MDLILEFLDPDSWRSWDEPVVDRTTDASYLAELQAAREATGLDESVITGEGTLSGRRVAMAAGEFGFLGGSIGVTAAQRLVAAIRRATAQGLPLLASPSSGGTRMQEGTVAFVQMVAITDAIRDHRSAGLPYLVYLRHPTTGGVLASWGSLGHVTVAEPGALIGFLGPRVYRALYGEEFPAGVQVAENLYRLGIVDAVIPASSLAGLTERALSVMCDRPDELPIDSESPDLTTDRQVAAIPDTPVWESVVRSRRPDRPGVRRLLRTGARDVVILHGTQEGESDVGLLLALARFGTAPCVVLGQDRQAQSLEGPMGPGALRAARRGMRLAEELRLPLVTVIDTPGAALSREAEERGLAGEIARSLYDLLGLTTPTLALLLGAGTGGAALALLPADRVIAAEHAWLSPLPPEGASVILRGDIDHAGELAARQGIRSADLHRDGIVDRIVPEDVDAADNPAAFIERLAGILNDELVALMSLAPTERRARRRARLVAR